ncbi:MAG: NAD-glutamate dehydrogenase [Alphaproteobacteria bacterium]|nr:NAD-glutamate dehydrogenase [Rickettsiales bacterium]
MKEKEKTIIFVYSGYLAQLGFGSRVVNAEIMQNEKKLTNSFVNMFVQKFSPSAKDDQSKNERIKLTQQEELHFLQEVNSLQNKEVKHFFAKLLSVFKATVRTNYFVDDGKKSYLSIKVKSAQIDGISKPYLFAEIFIYHNDFEAVHLRSSLISRGGLRWSNRGDDFRTEVFALVKAQILKNCVIVPSGSKGGFFILKDEPSEEDVVRCYKHFLKGALDITDNIVNNTVVHPKDVVRYDGEDPYLVVAADRGTASFSDHANSVSQEYNFWLGDAFASGGSDGYNHKELGITAKGAWESVKWHLLERGIGIESNTEEDVLKQTITAVGIGGMLGDVFGNGLIYSSNIKLLASFSGDAILIDPDPDPIKSFHERSRLFNDAKNASWRNYSPDLISKGGGVFSRNSSQIPCSEEMNKMFNFPDGTKNVSTEKLIKAILRLPVDLLWSGGVGTFVKASHETHKDAQDSVNDTTRINANELGAKIISEGANLSLTQAARVEYSKNGGSCYTDSTDNVAGVNCSDNEVNIKILLQDALLADKINRSERSSILRNAEQDVVEGILSNNHRQAGAIKAIHCLDVSQNISTCSRALNRMVAEDILDLDVNIMPDKNELLLRQSKKQGFVQPEISVLLSHAKLRFKTIFQKEEGLSKENIFHSYLLSYFPKKIQTTFLNEINRHRLKKELIATTIANELVNTFSLSFYDYIMEESTNASMMDFLKVYSSVLKVIGLQLIMDKLEKISFLVGISVRFKILFALEDVIKKAIVTVLTSSPSGFTVNKNVFKAITEKALLRSKNGQPQRSANCLLDQDSIDIINKYDPSLVSGDKHTIGIADWHHVQSEIEKLFN